MNEEQKQRALQIWRDYLPIRGVVLNKNFEFTLDQLDQQRQQNLPEFLFLLKAYLAGRLPLAQFKTKLDSTHKRIRNWGFQSVNGQMFFNLLATASKLAGTWDDLDALLKQSLQLPISPDQAAVTMDDVVDYVNTLANRLPPSRSIPRVGSVPFFISYFWHIQSPQNYPIYYEATVRILRETDLWNPDGSYGETYLSFYRVNHELVELFSQANGSPQNIWEVEHAFWYLTLDDLPLVDGAVLPVTTAVIPRSIPRNPAIGRWDRCVCPICDKGLMGYDLDDHTRTYHKGVEPGYQNV